MKRKPQPRFNLTLVAQRDTQGDDPHAIRRLRALLKYAGRRLGLRCVECWPEGEKEDGND